ncbi:MAG: SH3 domain-containing protein, partial [Candidatus Latescibacterota bacterium]
VSAPEILPNCTAAMNTPAFWIDRLDGDPDKVLLTPARILSLNRTHRTKPLDTRDINGDPYTIRDFVESYDRFGVQPVLEDPLAIRTFPGDSLRTRFRMAREWVLGRKLWDRRQLPFTAEMKEELFVETEAEKIPETVKPEYGILVRHTLHRIMPTRVQAFSGQYSWLDMFQAAGLETGMPVAILHRSKKGDWLYVKTAMSFGWVPRENVAVAPAPKVREIAETSSFVVSLDHRVPVYRDRACTDWVDDLFLGSKLPLAEKTSAGYRVRVPVCGPDGGLAVIDGWIRPDAAVSIGYQPFTRRNLIETAFRLLGRPYGWAGSNHERSCSELARTVLKTFGILVPRGMLLEINYADAVYSMKEKTPPEAKYKVLDVCGGGATLCGSRQHIVIYLGKVEGRHYVIHSNGYSYHGEDGTEYRVACVSVNDMELEGGSDIRTITDISTFDPK